MSTVNTTNVKNAASSTNNLVLGSTGDTQVQSLNTGPLAGLRNQIISGNFSVYQRGVQNTTNSATTEYGLDRWIVGPNTSWSLIASPNSPVEFAAAQRLQGTSITTFTRQMIELPLTGVASPFALDTEWTFSFWTTVNSTSDVNVSIGFADNNIFLGNDVSITNGNQPATQTGKTITINSGINFNTWYQYSYTFTVNKSPAATNLGLYVGVAYLNNSGADCGITGVQLEPGPVATPFENIPIALELSLCQRYFYKYTFAGSAATAKGLVFKTAGGTTMYPLQVTYPVTMRAAPTIDLSQLVVRISTGAGGTPTGVTQSSAGSNENMVSLGATGLPTNTNNVLDFSNSFTAAAEL